jgi:hypothetical integral membrane protein (TIGR02206 family)
MESWFGKTIEKSFEAFSTNHMMMLAVYLFVLVSLFITYKKILYHHQVLQTIRWLLFGLLFISELSYQVWAVVNDVWNLRDHMPLHLCGLASITAMIALVTKNKTLILLTFFIGIIPAFLALVTPELAYNYQHYRFWKFFIHHMAISWTGVFLILTNEIKITLPSLLKTFFFVLLYALVIGVFVNPALGSNYLYLSNKPISSTPLDILGKGYWYYQNLIIAAFIVFLFLFFLAKILSKK